MPAKVLADLRRRLDPLARSTSPLSAPPPRENCFGSPLILSRVHWVKPQFVAEITYLTWTEAGPRTGSCGVADALDWLTANTEAAPGVPQRAETSSRAPSGPPRTIGPSGLSHVAKPTSETSGCYGQVVGDNAKCILCICVSIGYSTSNLTIRA